ncbi:hypothetical protein [Aliarcobacter butzleri]|uniref:hypothetical protein n=1 Tax=Aliarcobacter butzleri TaxID=28197 RepID=UPI002B24035A|nr:hypothetical protein [Aliarcobacter butzleri]
MEDIELFSKIEDFLDNFKAPLTTKIYDYTNDRAGVINKFLFTEEKITIKSQEIEEIIKNKEDELHNSGKKIDLENRELRKIEMKDIQEKIGEWKKIVSNHDENVKKNNEDLYFKEGFSNTIFKEVDYKNLNNLSFEELESYKKLGVTIEKFLPEDKLKNLKDRYEKLNEISYEEYKEEYKKIEDKSFNIEVNESYLEPLIKTFFNRIKPNALIKDLEWLHDRFIFMAEDSRRRINDKEDSDLYNIGYVRNYKNYDDFTHVNHDKRNHSYIESLSTTLFSKMIFLEKRPYSYPLEKHKPKLAPDIDIEPVYGIDFVQKNSQTLLTVGIAHLFRDNPIYLLHLNNSYNNYYWLETKENREYLASGYKPGSFSANIVERTKKLKIKDKNLFDIKSYEEIEKMNLTRDEKFDLFLKILYAMDSNPYKEKHTPFSYNYEEESQTIDFSKAKKSDILKYFRLSNELNPITRFYENGDAYKRRSKFDISHSDSKEVGVVVTNFDQKLDLNKDFYLVHSLYNHVYKKFDFDREIQSKGLLKNYWDNLVEPWLKIENSRNNFFHPVRYKIQQDLDLNKNERYQFFKDEKTKIVTYVNSLFNKYSIDARNSDFFNANLEPEILANEIIEALKKALIDNDYKTPRERESYNYDFGYDWENKNAVRLSDIEELFERNDINSFYIENVKKELNEISKWYKYQLHYLGRQGSMIFEATMNYAIERFLNLEIIPKEFNPVDLFIKNTKIHIENMVKEYDDPNYITREQPPYFPTIRHFIENWNLDLEKDELNPLFDQIKKEELIEKLGSNEIFNGRTISNKVPNLGLYNIEHKHINPLNNIAYQLMKHKETNVNDLSTFKINPQIYKIQRDLEDLQDKAKNLRTIRKNSLEEFNLILKDIVDYKENNHIVENIIDKDKMIETMKTMVMMSKNFKNKNSIIDLSNIDNINEELSKLNNELNNINDITKAGLILNYIFTMNELYKKNKVDKKEISIDTLNIDKAKAMVLQNIFFEDKEMISENLKQEKHDYIKSVMKDLDYLSEDYKNSKITPEDFKNRKNEILNKEKEKLAILNKEIEETKVNEVFVELQDKFIRDSVILNDSFNYEHDNSIKDKFEGVEIYNGKHFPLFIDLKSLTIFSVEWTTRYPTLNIVTLPDNLAKLEIDINKQDLFNINEKQFTNKMDYIKINDRVKLIEKSLENNKDYYETHPLHKSNILDKVSDLLGTIQTNYFIQLEQDFDKALFLNLDPLTLEEPKPNHGSVTFMNKNDFDYFLDHDSKLDEHCKNNVDYFKNKIEYVDRYNFNNKNLQRDSNELTEQIRIDGKLTPYNMTTIYQEDIYSPIYKKINGMFSSSGKNVITNIKKDLKSHEVDSMEVIYNNENYLEQEFPKVNEIQASINSLTEFHLGKDIEESFIKTTKGILKNKVNLDERELIIFKNGFKNLKLFETKEELENYKRKYNLIMNEENNENKTILR